MSSLSREKNISELERQSFDLVIIGGGITGACLAYDATTRGLKTALIEKSDFGHATSSASSKILHGGIRFLQQLRFDKVRESALERIYFQNLVPHLCHYLPFAIPTFPKLKEGKLLLGAGAVAYSLISAGQNRQAIFSKNKVPLPKLVSRQELQEMVPWLGESWPATGGMILPECHMKSSERVTLALILAAVNKGCVVSNYADVQSIGQKHGAVESVQFNVNESDVVNVKTSAVANCAGPWQNKLNQSMPGNSTELITSFFRGSHLVLKDLELQCALALPTKQKIKGVAGRGGRHVFLIPWRNHVLLGTSYAHHSSDLDSVSASIEDKEQLLNAVNGAFGSDVVSEKNIVHSYSGLYPLTASSFKEAVYQGPSDYIITKHNDCGGVKKYYSLFGAKFTTARKLAELACSSIVQDLGEPVGPCITKSATVPAADVADVVEYCKQISIKYEALVSEKTIHHLFENYGTELEKILDIAREDPLLANKLASNRDNIAAEAVFCARNEMVIHLDDFIFRRTGIGTIGNPGLETIKKCADILAKELGWSSREIQSEIEATLARFGKGIS